MKSMKMKDGTVITFPDKIYSDDELVDLWAAVGWKHIPRRERLTIAEISRVEPDGYYIAMDGEYIVAHCGWVDRGDIFQTCGTKVSKGYTFRSYKGEGISNVLRQKRLKVIGRNPAMSFINNSTEGWLKSLMKEGWEIGSAEDLPEQYRELAQQLSDSYTILILNIKSKAMKKAWEILKGRRISTRAVKLTNKIMADGNERTVKEIIILMYELLESSDSNTTGRLTIPTKGELVRYFSKNREYVSRRVSSGGKKITYYEKVIP